MTLFLSLFGLLSLVFIVSAIISKITRLEKRIDELEKQNIYFKSIFAIEDNKLPPILTMVAEDSAKLSMYEYRIEKLESDVQEFYRFYYVSSDSDMSLCDMYNDNVTKIIELEEKIEDLRNNAASQ